MAFFSIKEDEAGTDVSTSTLWQHTPELIRGKHKVAASVSNLCRVLKRGRCTTFNILSHGNDTQALQWMFCFNNWWRYITISRAAITVGTLLMLTYLQIVHKNIIWGIFCQSRFEYDCFCCRWVSAGEAGPESTAAHQKDTFHERMSSNISEHNSISACQASA